MIVLMLVLHVKIESRQAAFTLLSLSDYLDLILWTVSSWAKNITKVVFLLYRAVR